MPKKKSTEYVRAFRERQRAKRPPKKPPKSSSERCREYRARKKALLNAVLKDGVESSSALPTNASSQRANRPPKSSSERCREYRARKKALLSAAHIDGGGQDSPLPTDASSQRANRPPKSSSERCREYRARKKALLNAAHMDGEEQDSTLPIHASPQPAIRPPKSSTERCREYRARKKALLNAEHMDGMEQDHAVPADASPQGLVKRIVDFMSEKETISIFTLNCQSLRKQAADLRDEVVRKSSILVLTETWVQTNEPLDVPNFDCVVSFKRPETKAGGVAIYRNSMNRSITVSPHILINLNQTDTMTTVSTSSIGDICSARCRLENGQFMLIVAIYISPNRKINDIIEFIHHVLLPYTLEGAALLKKDWGSLPMILSGDFNVNFAQPQAQPLIDFFEQKFSLKLTSDKNMSTTRFGTTIDAVFSRALETITSQTVCFLF